ncbi:MAG: hypothetical protein RJB38_640 [Pseudomonadota bacterium]
MISGGIKWLARLGLNQRPLPCQGSALPLSYEPTFEESPTLLARARPVNPKYNRGTKRRHLTLTLPEATPKLGLKLSGQRLKALVTGLGK